ncbi:MAG: hypothetical protein PHH49_02280 [Candidatus Omnitrophica bacterium]|nr:hypothetical protein [Candidatus Omnitrophota bacterium]MDD5487774.1 hypothetical protein [Candidatus Omnitrophota bacterium]
MKKYIFVTIDILTHVLVTALVSFYLYKVTGRVSWIVLCFAGGVLIDLDHLLDYFVYYGGTFSPGKFFSHAYLGSGKCYLVFHSYELLIALWVFGAHFHLMIPVAAGMTGHMLIDLLYSHRRTPLALSLFYRAYLGFSAERAGMI